MSNTTKQPIKSFAALKRVLQVGVKLRCVYRRGKEDCNLMRTIIKRQTNALVMEPEEQPGTKSWMRWPETADQVRIDDTGFEVWERVSPQSAKVLARTNEAAWKCLNPDATEDQWMKWIRYEYVD